MKQQTSKHEFSLYVPAINSTEKAVCISDRDLVHRIFHVLRLAIGDTVVFFDGKSAVRCVLTAIEKRVVCCDVFESWNIKPLAPPITWVLPLLERDAFEQALSLLTSMGASKIRLVITEKSKKKWGSPKDRERAHRLMVAAAEQSKQFVIPEIVAPVQLHAYLNEPVSAFKVYFDVSGRPAYEIVSLVRTEKAQEIICLIGPEGDLSESEKDFIKNMDWVLCALTPTVLRSWQAVAVGMGLIRSCTE